MPKENKIEKADLETKNQPNIKKELSIDAESIIETVMKRLDERRELKVKEDKKRARKSINETILEKIAAMEANVAGIVNDNKIEKKEDVKTIEVEKEAVSDTADKGKDNLEQKKEVAGKPQTQDVESIEAILERKFAEKYDKKLESLKNENITLASLIKAKSNSDFLKEKKKELLEQYKDIGLKADMLQGDTVEELEKEANLFKKHKQYLEDLGYKAPAKTQGYSVGDFQGRSNAAGEQFELSGDISEMMETWNNAKNDGAYMEALIRDENFKNKVNKIVADQKSDYWKVNADYMRNGDLSLRK